MKDLKSVYMYQGFVYRNFITPDKILNRPYGMNYFMPLLLTLLATYIKSSLFINAGPSTLFFLYLGVIIGSGIYGGIRSAYVALIATVICSWIFYIYPQGSLIPSLSTIIVMVGYVLGALLVIGMITLIQVALIGLTNSEERFRRIVEKSTEGLMICNSNGQIVYHCPSVNHLLGYSNEDLQHKDLYQLIHPDELKEFRFMFLKLQLSGRNSMVIQQRFKTLDGKWIWIECCIDNLLNDKFVKALVIHFRNITNRIDHERQQEDFVHMASHELKNPITALKGYLQLLDKRLEKQGEYQHMQLTGRIDSQVDKLLSLIDNMLNITKIKAGELQYHFEHFDVNECIKEAVESMQASTSTHHIELSLPEASILNGDKIRIGQVIVNLINNAVKYSPDGEIVKVTVIKESAVVRIKVADNGIGIPQEKQKRIFDRFYRVDTLPKGKFQGLGLGLYITWEIVKQHGGKLGVNSEEGKGSEFWFTLPMIS